MANNDWVDKDWAAAVRSGLSSVFESEDYADMTIICGNETFRAHKVVVCEQSKFFKKAFAVDMMEKANNEIVIRDKQTDVIHAMLSFMYEGDYMTETYQGDDENAPKHPNILVFHANVFAAADEFQVEHLKAKAIESFRIDAFREHPVEARKMNIDEGFMAAVAEIYASTPSNERGLRDAAVSCFCKYYRLAKPTDDALAQLNEVGEFKDDIMKAWGRDMANLNRHHCPNCTKHLVQNAGREPVLCYGCCWKSAAYKHEAEMRGWDWTSPPMADSY